MKHKFIQIIAFLTLSFHLFSCTKSDRLVENNKLNTSPHDSLTMELKEIQDQNILPGFAVSVFSADSILYEGGFGYMDLENKKPFTVNSVQIIASITKTLVGVSLMKLVEEGKLDLDEDINSILPFQVINPNFRNEVISPRHLATHTSSISDAKNSDTGYRFSKPLMREEFPETYEPLLENLNKTDAITIEDFLRNKLNEDEKWYEKGVFTTYKPGTNYEYSNLGVTLLAYIIELKSGSRFDRFTKEQIIDPLEMTYSTWDLNKIDPEYQTHYYNELMNIIPPYYIISYPDGGLYSSVSDMTIFLQEIMKGYTGKGMILSLESIREMIRRQYADEDLTEGLCWDLSFPGLVGHAGNDFGTSTLMYFSPETGIGRILFSNISIETEELQDAFYGVYNKLFEYEFHQKSAN